MQQIKAGDSYRKALVYAKQLAGIPDYSNEAVRESLSKLGPFKYEEDDEKMFDI